MWASHDRCIHDRGVLVKGTLNFDTVNILTAADQDVLFPINDGAKAFVVKFCQVTCFYPTVDKGLSSGLGFVPISFDHIGTLGPKLAHAASG